MEMHLGTDEVNAERRERRAGLARLLAELGRGPATLFNLAAACDDSPALPVAEDLLLEAANLGFVACGEDGTWRIIARRKLFRRQKDAAEAIGVGETTLGRWVREGLVALPPAIYIAQGGLLGFPVPAHQVEALPIADVTAEPAARATPTAPPVVTVPVAEEAPFCLEAQGTAPEAKPQVTGKLDRVGVWLDLPEAAALAEALVDLDHPAAMRVRAFDDAFTTVTGNLDVHAGTSAVADPRSPAAPVIISDDDCWHRPLTTLELAALQSFPTAINGAPLVLTGRSSSRWRMGIGNAVPPATARAIGEQMLRTLLVADAGAFALSEGGGIWVREADGVLRWHRSSRGERPFVEAHA